MNRSVARSSTRRRSSDGWARGVELLDRPACWQPGEAQPSLQAALFDGLGFGGEQVGEEPRVAGLVLLGGL